MDVVVQKLLAEFRGAWRFRWQALIVAWVVCILGWLVVFVLPDQYEADARFYVDTTTRLDEVIDGIVIEADEGSQITLVRQAMLSRPSLERVARETDLDLGAYTPEDKEQLIDSLSKSIEISSTNSQERGRRETDGIYKISFRHADRQKSFAVVDAMLDTFREDVVSGRAQGSEETINFLQKEIADYGTQLELKETDLAEFKRDKVGLLPGQGKGYFELLQEKLTSARVLEAEHSVLIGRRTALIEQVRGERPMLEDGGSGGNTANPRNDLESRINDLEASIDEMLTQFTEKWPDVIAARDQLEQLRQRRDEELAELTASGESGGVIPSNNPVYQHLQISLNETNVEIGEYTRRIAALRSEISELQERVEIAPQIEADLAAKTRDLHQIRTVYGSLREKLQQEEIRQKRLSWGGVTFRVIDPPKVGLRPVAPLRVQLILLVVVAGLGAGGGLAYLLQMLKPVFMDQGSLRELTGLPVLGSVNMAWQAEHWSQRRHELVTLSVAAAAILVFAILALVFMDAGVHAGAEIRRIAAL